MVESILNIKKCKKCGVAPVILIRVHSAIHVEIYCPKCNKLEKEYKIFPKWDEENRGLILEETIDRIVTKWNEAKECGY